MKNWKQPNVEEVSINATSENWEAKFGGCSIYNTLDGVGRCDYWNAGKGEECPFHKNSNGKGYCSLKSGDSGDPEKRLS